MGQKIYDLTNPQKSIWYTEQFFKGSTLNNICGSMFVDEIVDFDLLKKAINQFVKDNDGFRFELFYDENGEIKQKVVDFKPFDIELVDLKSKDEISNLENDMTNEPFSLIENKLYRLKMYRLPDGRGGFLLIAHHLIYDAYTASLVTSKVVNIYSALKKGEECPEKPTSYINYINSENEYLQSDKFEKDKEYWNGVFETVPEIGTIPSIREATENSCKALRKTFVISKEKMQELNDFCSNNKISIFNLFMGLYAIYIGKVSNLDDFVIGTPILNRSNFEEKNTPGTFISTVPFRFVLDDSKSFIDFEKEIASGAFSMFRHQKYPYQNILDDIRKKNPSQPNLYDILLSYQNARNNRNSSDIPYRTRWTFNNNVADSMQIHLFDINDDGALSISYDYRINKYDEVDIENIHNRILYMVEQILYTDDILLKDIDIVTSFEKSKILNEFNNTKKDYTFTNNIVEMIQNVAEKFPDKIAIETENSSITYRELMAKMNQLSNYLLDKNIPENSNIGIFTTRTIDTIIGILAVLKINCTYVPIDIEYPIDRISYMIDISKIEYILSEDADNFNIITDLNNIKKISINYNDYKDKSFLLEKHFNYNYNNNLYIIFTSGSTGRPKGVTITHKNMINLMLFEKNETTIFSDIQNKILQFATMSFDVSYQEIYSSLLFGNTLVLIDDSSRKDMNKLSKYIYDKGINTLFIPPAYLKLLVEDINIRNLIKSSVKNVITAGEALVITDGIKDLIESGITIHNHYGPAETHVATAYTINKDHIMLHPPIGKPISNSYIHILDSNMNLCPIGVIGQIAISGTCVGNGYWNNLDLTNEKFLINKYNNEKMYLTGDLGFFDFDGNIGFIGRSDFQVKLNGFRVELDEIDQVLIKNQNVKSSVSIIHEENAKKYIITYYTENASTNEDDLIKYLSSTLPFYMIPKKLVKLDRFPINQNGKIDKKSLPKVTLSESNAEYIEPKTITESHLVDIWKELFNANKIGINYNFFDIGGDSLLSIKLSSIILAKFNVDINVGDIFDNPTIYELAKLIDSKQNIKYDEIEHCEYKEYYNTSSAQRRVYFASKLSGDNSIVYNMPGVIIFDKRPDIEKLNYCFNKIIDRHSSLRTYFEVIETEVKQKILDKLHFQIKQINYEDRNINNIIKDFVRPFDLSKPPLIRAELAYLPDKILLLFDMHHIISDGMSLSILTKELCDLYNDKELNYIDFNYIDYAEWENSQLENNNFRSSKEFWVNQFKDDIPVLNMPTDYPRPAVQSFEGSKIYSSIPKRLTEKINNLSKKLDVSNYMILLACYYILLSKYTSQEDIVVGTPVLGRNKKELLDIIGMFVNSMPLKNHIDSSITFNDFLNTIKKNSIDAINHLEYPFDELVKDLDLKRDSSRNPLFDTMFIYQNDGYTPVKFNGLESQLYIPNTGISKFDLSLEVVPNDGELNLSFEYATALFEADTIERLSTHYINIVNEVMNNTDIKISDINMLSDDEKNEILYNFNDTAMEYNKKQNITQMIEKQCDLTPDNIAITFEDSFITYRELNERANQLARYMKKFGIGRNSIVGIMLPRSLEVLVSIFAVLKTGACYIPIDPSFPKNRIDYMLENSNADLLLCFDNSYEFEKTLDVRLHNSKIYDGDNHNLDIINLPTDPSYIIYTSGSTGNPKGVMLNHLALTNLTNSLNNSVEFLKNPVDNMSIASITTISFDIFIFETLICLQKGLKIVMANNNEQVTAELLDNLIERHSIKAIQMTPSRMRIFIDNKDKLPHLADLKYIVLAGEALPDKLLADILEIGNITVYNGYGPSETTVFSTFTDVTNYEKVNIGKPIANTQIYILDKDLNTCPIGVPGEIYIAGDGVGIGYINNPEITKERFLSNKFDNTTLYYRTGDLAKYLPNGEIEYIGRIDNQIKIRGLRIELNEIENWILKFPNIEKCVVTPKTDDKDRTFLIAYIVVNNRIAIANLRSYLGNNMPRYMVPSYFVTLEELPYLPNGKINKKALPLPNLSTINSNEKYCAPRNDLEVKIANAFEKILNVSPISVKDNFFELGGDSLLAMSLQIELMKISNNITYSDIFMHSTVEELANKINTYLSCTYTEFSAEDFKDISGVLDETNTIYKSLKKNDIGNILLTGVTGFLGSHILDEYLKQNPKGIAYCLIRTELGLSLEKKLLDKLHFYFGDKYDKLVGNRIIIINGDIGLDNLGLSEQDSNTLVNSITTVINSAAIVAHFGNYSLFKKINVDGVAHLIEFCKQYKKRLYQISTLSISGNTFDTGSYIEQNFTHEIIFKENNFFINQSLNNVYVRSKFEAEKLILEAINNGLDGYILRIGNLMPRLSDGKFQVNVNENAYVNRLLAFMKLKAVPDYLIDGYTEFTPVDSCAQAILKVVEYPTLKNRIFHLFNHNHVDIKLLLNIFNEYEHIEILDNEDFVKYINKILSLPDSNELLSGILSDFDKNKRLIYESNIKLNSDFTIDYLKKTDFKWPIIDKNYLSRFIEKFIKED